MLILLIVGAAWLAVLLPPLFRSRIDSRPVSSVSDFRRQLYTLQRTQAPMRAQAPLRAMSRPLAPTPAHLRPIMRAGHAPQRLSDSPEIAYMSARGDHSTPSHKCALRADWMQWRVAVFGLHNRLYVDDLVFCGGSCVTCGLLLHAGADPFCSRGAPLSRLSPPSRSLIHPKSFQPNNAGQCVP